MLNAFVLDIPTVKYNLLKSRFLTFCCTIQNFRVQKSAFQAHAGHIYVLEGTNLSTFEYGNLRYRSVQATSAYSKVSQKSQQEPQMSSKVPLKHTSNQQYTARGFEQEIQIVFRAKNRRRLSDYSQKLSDYSQKLSKGPKEIQRWLGTRPNQTSGLNP